MAMSIFLAYIVKISSLFPGNKAEEMKERPLLAIALKISVCLMNGDFRFLESKTLLLLLVQVVFLSILLKNNVSFQLKHNLAHSCFMDGEQNGHILVKILSVNEGCFKGKESE